MKSATTYLAALALSVALFAFTSTAQGQSNSADIVDLAVQTESLSTLVEAVKAGGLVETLKGEGPYTVFAPTNEAFEKLPAGTLESLLKPENKDKLVQILTYHVVPGNVMSTDLEDGMTAKTAEGSEIEVNLGESVMINNATVVKADIKATNGVVHVIDTVIMPPKKESSGGY